MSLLNPNVFWSLWIIPAAFVTAALSFWPAKWAGWVVCGLVFFLSAGACLIMVWLTTFTLDDPFAGPAELRPITQADLLASIGLASLGLYFVICALCCFPWIPSRFLRSIGIGAHFALMPVALMFAGAIESETWTRTIRGSLVFYSGYLELGLAYALLWFRMAYVRQTVLKKIAAAAKSEPVKKIPPGDRWWST